MKSPEPWLRRKPIAPNFWSQRREPCTIGPQQLVLLGDVPATTYHHWKSKGVRSLSLDTLERISLVLGIWKGLRLLFADDAVAVRWLKAENTDLPFGGLSPLDAMLRGSIDDLYAVRRYVDGWRGVWP